MKTDLQIFDSPSQQRKLHVFHDVLEYLFIIIVSLSATIAAFITFLAQFKMHF
ncbi:hypothetical protein HNQ74_001345 [Bartonella doshiae]|uniref:Uncharacterized protein n=2 Tax=Bartonella doshiae TaxID=33044 RepID=A0A380ZEL7_BARDO|nr:hypothetical protein MCS_01549 [Bartonella doshiae NCTC 12862 = ATCC 700133]MBB6159903.1 hypothetical protein [Bartonella doshiae]SUV45419.1 Uncharacterised protein [Bartonella doshiae]